MTLGGVGDRDFNTVLQSFSTKKTKKASSPPTGADATKQFVAFMERAERSRVNDRTRKAIKLYQQALGLRADRPEPHLGLGWSYLDQNQTKRAVSSFKKALSLKPSLSEAQFGMAESYNAAGRTNKAIQAYQKYLRMAPKGQDAAIARRALKGLEYSK